MLFLSENFFRQHQLRPFIVVCLQSLMGYCLYSMQASALDDIVSTEPIYYNGTNRIGETRFYNSTNIVLDHGVRLLNIGTLAEALSPDQNILGNFHANELTDLSVTLNNADHHFSKRIGHASFLNQAMRVTLGYQNFSEQMTLFSGRITNETLTATTLELTAQNDNN